VSLNRRRLALASLGFATVITALGVTAFRLGLHPGLGPVLLAAAVLTAPGAFCALWAPEGSYWGMMLVLCVTNIVAWTLIAYQAVVLWQRLRRRVGET
jgi:hypothetical protein